MRRGDLEHLVRVAAAITGEQDFVVLEGSALLASVAEPPPELQRASDVDLYPQRTPSLAGLIEASIGELSAFHGHFGYYARAVDPNSAVLPHAWQSRLVALQVGPADSATARCLEPHDLAAAKIAAHHQKDLSFVTTLLERAIVTVPVLSERLDHLPLPVHRIRQLKAWLAGAVAAPAGQGNRDADFDGPEI
jgi:hypothetical protein